MAVTAHYSWTKPTVNADNGTWGGIANALYDAVDAALYALSQSAVLASSLASGVATFLGAPSSANLKAAITDETGSGALVFATSPTLVTPALGTPASGVLTNCTGLPNASVVGLKSGALAAVTVSTSAPSGGAAGDVWIQI